MLTLVERTYGYGELLTLLPCGNLFIGHRLAGCGPLAGGLR